MFLITGENLTYNIRVLLYRNLIYKQVSWFDKKDRAPGIISNVLSEDITNLNGLTSEYAAVIVESALTLVLGVAISAWYEWRMAVVCVIATPSVMLGGILSARLTWKGKAQQAQDPTKKAEDPYD